jgi:hypothetical protein
MGPEEIEFIIGPDGTVKEEVRGVKGTRCEEITAAIEDALGGEVVEREHKPEYYERERQTDSNTVRS